MKCFSKLSVTALAIVGAAGLIITPAWSQKTDTNCDSQHPCVKCQQECQQGNQSQCRQADQQKRQANATRRLMKRLNLTEEQQTKAEPIITKALQAMRDENKTSRENLRQKRMEIAQSAQKELNKILNSEQQAQLSEMITKMDEAPSRHDKSQGRNHRGQAPQGMMPPPDGDSECGPGMPPDGEPECGPGMPPCPLEQLNLSDKQKAALKEAHESMQKSREERRKANCEDELKAAKADKDLMDQKLKEILTDEQYKQFQEMEKNAPKPYPDRRPGRGHHQDND